MKRTILTACGALALCAALSSCYSLDHRVGAGATNGVSVEERQWYILWGLVPLNTVDSHSMAAGATDYDVNSEITALDFLFNIVTSFVTVYSQTVTVTK